MKKLIIAAIVGCLSTAASAGQSGGSDLTLTRVMLENGISFIEAAGIQNPEGCQLSNVAKLPTDPAIMDRYISLAVTALSSGLKVTIWVEGCGWAPWGTVPQIYHLSLAK